jgi:hypothetical protein
MNWENIALKPRAQTVVENLRIELYMRRLPLLYTLSQVYSADLLSTVRHSLAPFANRSNVILRPARKRNHLDIR